jgi:hypothetical protein
MRRKSEKKKTKRPKLRLGLPDLDQSKSAVLGSLRSPESRRGYRHAIDEFVEWYCSEPRLSLNRTVVMRYRNHLESRSLAPGSINVRLAAVRRLANNRLIRTEGAGVPAPSKSDLPTNRPLTSDS